MNEQTYRDCNIDVSQLPDGRWCAEWWDRGNVNVGGIHNRPKRKEAVEAAKCQIDELKGPITF